MEIVEGVLKIKYILNDGFVSADYGYSEKNNSRMKCINNNNNTILLPTILCATPDTEITIMQKRFIIAF